MKNVFYEATNDFRVERRNNLNFPSHIHNDIELIFCFRGSCKAHCDGKEYDIRPNDFFLIFPNQIHQFSECDTNGDYFIIILKAKDLIGYSNVFSKKIPTNAVYHCDSKNNMLKLLEIIYDDYINNQKPQIIIAQLTALFGKLLQNYTLDIKHTSNNLIYEIIQYCNNHYLEDISIENICSELNISRSYISHTFNDRLKMGFCEYINTLRLQDAATLLQTTNKTITQISIISGFSTVRTFNRVFLKKYGISPSKYRDSAN